MVNYKNGKIYKIVCNETNEIYIGSTTQTLTDRLCQHVSKFKHNNPRACMSKQIIERGNYNIELIEEYSCNNKEELQIREQYHMQNVANINKQSAYSEQYGYVLKNDQKEFLDKFIKENKCKIARDPIYQYLKKNHPEYKISRRQVMGYIRTNQHK
mmetsp:Transcript_32664/g.38318  ORF Transcript_32664/g.38318 Transcript_32664/m.38318 type:complete len:156 (+) Transcript_32664:95-562(+)